MPYSFGGRLHLRCAELWAKLVSNRHSLVTDLTIPFAEVDNFCLLFSYFCARAVAQNNKINWKTPVSSSFCATNQLLMLMQTAVQLLTLAMLKDTIVAKLIKQYFSV